MATPGVAGIGSGTPELAVVGGPFANESVTSALTPSERDVASLAAAGLSNAGIARCRGTAERTVANQMASILRKLQVPSRYALAPSPRSRRP
jgi:DNA-binding NarL/FixJ family response regulator